MYEVPASFHPTSSANLGFNFSAIIFHQTFILNFRIAVAPSILTIDPTTFFLSYGSVSKSKVSASFYRTPFVQNSVLSDVHDPLVKKTNRFQIRSNCSEIIRHFEKEFGQRMCYTNLTFVYQFTPKIYKKLFINRVFAGKKMFFLH